MRTLDEDINQTGKGQDFDALSESLALNTNGDPVRMCWHRLSDFAQEHPEVRSLSAVNSFLKLMAKMCDTVAPKALERDVLDLRGDGKASPLIKQVTDEKNK